MQRRVMAWVMVAGLMTSATAIATSSCSSSSSAAGLASGCAINSDCNSPLVCAFGLCHEQCAETRDCPDNQLCVSTGADKVCQFSQENACNAVTPCKGGLVCAHDNECRNACSSTVACAVAGQQCSTEGVCRESNELSDASSDAGVADTGVTDASVDTGTDVVVDAGCDPDAGRSGVLGYKPSNFDPSALAVADGGGAPDGGVDWVNPPNVTITIAGCTAQSCLGVTPVTITLVDGTQADLFVMNNFTVQTSGVLTLNNEEYRRPVIFAVLGRADIQGLIDLHGDNSGYAGAGGWPIPNLSSGQGTGGGSNGYSGGNPNSAAGGGGFCGTGGNGGGVAPFGFGGGRYGSADLIPLVAGSAGGYRGPGVGGYQTGPSGGAFQISAGISIVLRIQGAIHAGGSAADTTTAPGGGGSGGAVLLEAPTVDIEGRLCANGAAGGSDGTVPGGATATNQAALGGGTGGNGSVGAMVNGGDGTAGDAGVGSSGPGGGGAGYLRINTACGATIGNNAVVSPSVTTMCATQGTLKH